MKKTKEKTKLEIVKELSEELLKNLEIPAKLEVVEDQEKVISVQIEAGEPGVLIGYHGETLSSFQLILSLMVYRKTEEWTRILVNVGDYREKRQESLERLALSAAQKVKFSGTEYSLPPMSASERRIIHLALSSDPEVVTESEGEGYQRRVVVKPKK